MARWLGELGVVPAEHAEREGVHSWDLLLDGRRRRRVRITLILAPDVGIVAWVHYAPQLSDGFRRGYRQLLRWNDQLLFARFALAHDERIVLSAELPPELAERDRLGRLLARLLAVCDALLDASTRWLWPGGRPPASEGEADPFLLERFPEAGTDLELEAADR